MNTNISPRALRSSPKGSTMLTEANIGKSSVTVPKTLSWDQITRNTLWKIEDANIPRKKKSQNPLQIIEHDDGSIEIKFSEEPSSESKVKEFLSSRLSTSGVSRSMYDPLKVKEVSYEKNRASVHYEDGSRSPTHTDMDTQSVYESQLNVITADFQIDKELLKADFMSAANSSKRKAFFQTYKEAERSELRAQWYSHMETIEENISFFEWFE